LSAVLSSLTGIPSLTTSPDVQPDSSRFDAADESAISERSHLLSRRGSREIPQKSGRLAGLMGFSSGVGALIAGEFPRFLVFLDSLTSRCRSFRISTTSNPILEIRCILRRRFRFSRRARKRISLVILLRCRFIVPRSDLCILRITGQIVSPTRDWSTG